MRIDVCSALAALLLVLSSSSVISSNRASPTPTAAATAAALPSADRSQQHRDAAEKSDAISNHTESRQINHRAAKDAKGGRKKLKAAKNKSDPRRTAAPSRRLCERTSRHTIINRPDPKILLQKYKRASTACPCGVIEYSEIQRQYFYSLKDISIGGMCICNGHASDCSLNPITQLFSCSCQHNTMGQNCESCSPAFNQYRWQPGMDGFVCQPCNCHGHADECYFDEEVEKRGESLNSDGKYIGGGVCIRCRHFTEGINCERCIDGYYRPYQITPDAVHPCVRCQCHASGTKRNQIGSFECVKDVDESGRMPGTCKCKQGYSGMHCDRCEFGYQGFPHCYPCACSVQGSLNNDPCAGDCICKENVIGNYCDQCKPGMFNLDGDNPLGCEDCFCNGATTSCRSSNLKWSKIETLEDWELRSRGGRRVARPISKDDYLEIKHDQVSRELGTTTYYWLAPADYQGNRLASYGGLLRYTVMHKINARSYHVPLHYTDVILEAGNKKSLRYTGDPAESLQEHERSRTFTIRLQPTPNRPSADEADFQPHHGWYDAQSRLPAAKDDFMLVLSDVRRLMIRAVYSRHTSAIYGLKDVQLDDATVDGEGMRASSVEKCNCPPGYSGNSCEVCQPGFWRNGFTCERCECNGHSQLCDKFNGACRNCDHNTMGMNCERCKPGYYGDATTGSQYACLRCECPLRTTENNFSPTCHMELITGEIICNRCPPGYAGKRCESCTDGYFGDPTQPGGGCRPCQCNGNSLHCDKYTGKCLSCVAHTAGDNCERCQIAYYGDAITQKNCGSCDCDPIGSTSRQCDIHTGQCPCIANVYGRRCNACASTYYLSQDSRMCVPCNCNHVGRKPKHQGGESCRSDGSCYCRRGVEGDKCDRCSRGYFDFENGCRKCNCPETGGNCDKETGECVCPPNTEGPSCRHCSPGSYGWHFELGCKECKCKAHGTSASHPCDSVTGECFCNAKYRGESCDQCRIGYYGYPSCRTCDCNHHGTVVTSCSSQNAEQCECNRSGQCQCKKNVIGKHCDACKPGFFGFSSENKDGCTRCYCSGITTDCRQSSLVFVEPIVFDYFPTRSLNKRRPMIRGLSAGDEEVSSLLPYYWRLPFQFNGDKSLSYGGKLSYVVYYESKLNEVEGEKRRANVVLQGGRYQNLTIQYFAENPASGKSQMFVVPMQEEGWIHLDGGRKASRHDFVSVLQDVRYFMIKAFYGHFMIRSKLSNVKLDFARMNSNTSSPGLPAHGIEQCNCPPGYIGLSCQDCAKGYMRVINNRGLATCKPCNCSNRSDVCEAGTGDCLNCKGKFTGKHCERCIPGYYLSNGECLKCACPSHYATNSYSTTCRSDGRSGYICDSCESGYEGKHCELCADGYFGDPTSPGGFCAKCGCNVAGSVDGACNKTTGQCHCDQGIKGRVCDQCEPYRVITVDGCQECTDDCSGKLLQAVDDLNSLLGPITTFNASLTYLEKLANATLDTNAILNMTVHELQKRNSMYKKKYKKIKKSFSRLQKEEKKCKTKSNKLNAKVNSTAAFADKLDKRTAELLKDSIAINQKMRRLRREMEKGKDQTNQDLDDNILDMIERMENMSMDEYLKAAKDELREAKAFLDQVNSTIEISRLQLKKVIKDKLRAANKTIAKLQQRLQAAENIISGTNQRLALTNTTNNVNRQLLRQTQSSIEKLKNEATITHKILEDANEMMKEAINKTALAAQEIDNQKLLTISMKNNSMKLRDKIDAKMGGNDLNDLRSAVEIAEHQGEKLEELVDYILETYDNVTAYSRNRTAAVDDPVDIFQAISEAKRKATEALKFAREARDRVDELPSADEIDDLLKKSEDIIDSAPHYNRTLKANRNQLSDLNEALHSANISVAQLDKKRKEYFNQIINLNKQPRMFGKTLDEVDATNEETNEVLSDINDQLDDFDETVKQIRDVRKKLKNKAKSLRNIKNKMDEIPEKLARARRSVDELDEKRNQIKGAKETLNENIDHLRRMIEESRKKAAEIEKPSVKSTGGCAMTYSPSRDVTKETHVNLNFKTSRRNNLLFYLARVRQDFLAVELRNGFVTVTWNLGGGVSSVVHPMNVSTLVGDSGQEDWYQVDVYRQNRMVNLTVKRNGDESELQTVTGESPEGFTVLDISEKDYLFVGGAPDSFEVHDALEYHTFAGCMGKAILQGKSVGLWSFRSISNEKDCNSCLEVPADNYDIISVYGFFGKSYSAVPLPNWYNGTRVWFRATLKSFISNATIMYLGTNTEDFLSVELSGGKVVVKADLGSGILTVMSDSAYNNGEEFSIDLRMGGTIGILKIQKGDVIKRFLLDITSSDGSLDLNGDERIYIGGFPAESIANIRDEVNKDGFIGCIRKILFGQDRLNLKDVGIGQEEVIESDVSTSCPQYVNNIGFGQNGYIELEPIDLYSYRTLVMSFQTRSPNALLLVGVDRDTLTRRRKRRKRRPSITKREGYTREDFYSVFLSNGFIVARLHLDGGSVMNLISRENFYNDGNVWLVTLRREGGNVTMQINDNNDVTTGSHLHTTKTLKTKRVFIGGVPDGFEIGSIATENSTSLKGCLLDFFVGNLTDLKQPKEQRNVYMGSCSPVEDIIESDEPTVSETSISKLREYIPPDGIEVYTESTLSSDTAAENAKEEISNRKEDVRCGTPNYSKTRRNIAHFGKHAHSYLVYNHDLQKPLTFRKLVISLRVRTFARTGLLLYTGDYKGSDYFALKVKDGKPIFQFSTSRGSAEMVSERVINDGKWHKIKIKKQRRKGVLQIDKKRYKSSAKGDAKMHVEPMLYVGGVPVEQKEKVGTISQSMDACISNIVIGKEKKHFRNALQNRGVEACHRFIEPGAFFKGQGSYVKYKSMYRVGTEMEVSLQFKTFFANGILLNVNDPRKDLLSLELNEGKVIFRADNGGGIFQVEYSLSESLNETCSRCSRTLCDGEWHMIIATKKQRTLTLEVDDHKIVNITSPTHQTSADTRHPLFIGGIPNEFKPSYITSPESFHGCLRHVAIKGVAVDFEEAVEHLGVIPNSCPSTNRK